MYQASNPKELQLPRCISFFCVLDSCIVSGRPYDPRGIDTNVQAVLLSVVVWMRVMPHSRHPLQLMEKTLSKHPPKKTRIILFQWGKKQRKVYKDADSLNTWARFSIVKSYVRNTTHTVSQLTARAMPLISLLLLLPKRSKMSTKLLLSLFLNVFTFISYFQMNW